MGLLDDERITAVGLFMEAHAAIASALARDIEAVAGISGAEFGVLLSLARTPGERLRMTDLAAQASLSTSGMTRLVDRLEAAGFVERTACPSDRRGLEAVLTPTGRALVEKAIPVHLESIQRVVIDPLGGDLKSLEAPMRILRDSARKPC
jgi:DNA-binding MarR family transcriptional regulator